MKTRKKGYNLLLGLTILFSIMIVTTLIPDPSASKPCLLGYHAHCTFAPISTVIAMLAAGAMCLIRNKKLSGS
ncbi:hypothetical protein JW948_16090 [bacterium]|nr:hypothetical protein [bacterium]